MGTVVVVGSANVDVVVTARRFPRAGETVTGGSAAILPGGKGANQAVAARRAGATTRFAGRVGDDVFAVQLRAFLAAEDVGTGDLQDTSGVASGMAIVTVTELGENSIVVVPGANGSLSPADVRGLRIARGDVVVCQLEVPEETVAAALSEAREAGAVTVLNPAPAVPVARRVLALADLLVMNEVELAGYSGAPVDAADDGAVTRAAQTVREDDDQQVIVTLGRRGVLALVGGRVLRIDGHDVEALDTTGAGDCFVGVLAAGLAAGDDVGASVRRANLAASLAVGRRGAAPSMPTAAEIAAAASR